MTSISISTDVTGAMFAHVKLSDVKPNPFRMVDRYKIMPSKVSTLKNSIASTGFWTNVMGRLVDGELQIAYGHHRLAAALEVLGGDHVQTFPLEEYTDEMMLRIMAEENSDDWANPVEHGMLVTLAARDWLDLWLTENEAEAIQALTDYDGEYGFGSTTMSGSDIVPTEVMPFIVSNKDQPHAMADLLKAMAGGVEVTHVAIFLGKNYTKRANDNGVRPTSFIAEGWANIGVSPKRKAHDAAILKAQAEKEAEARAEAEATAQAEAEAKAARTKADAAETAKKEALEFAKRKSEAAAAAEAKAKSERERKALEAKRKAAEAEQAKAAAERKAAEVEAAKVRRAAFLAEQKAEAAAAAEAKAQERDAELTKAYARQVNAGLINPEATALLTSNALAKAFRELMVTNRVGEVIAADQQVEMVTTFLEWAGDDPKTDALQKFIMSSLKTGRDQAAVLRALEVELESQIGNVLKAANAASNAADGFRKVLDRIGAEGDKDKQAIMVRYVRSNQDKLENTASHLFTVGTRIEKLLNAESKQSLQDRKDLTIKKIA